MSARSSTVLERIVTETREEVERRKRDTPLPGGAGQASGAGGLQHTREHRFREALRGQDIGVIAEFKRRSPSAGRLRERPDLARMLSAYERGGAVAASILTEGPNFDGSLEDLRAARRVSRLPLLRKDFIVDEYQLHEALGAGADAVLLIVAALAQAELSALHRAATGIGLDVLVEVHDREELDRALEAEAQIIGINNRDLRDFSVDLGRTEMLMTYVPSGTTVVSESGIAGPEQLQRLRGHGVHAVLVGESLMRAADPAATLVELRTARSGTHSESRR